VLLQRGAEVRLDDAEQQVCRLISNLRSTVNRNAGVANKRIGLQENDLEIDLQGFGAELAFCKMCNSYPDLSIFVRSTAVDQGDVWLPDRRNVDVKHTKYQNGRLITPTWKTAKVSLYALMTGIFPRYIFRGAIPTERLMREENICDLQGIGKLSYGVRQDQLEDLEIGEKRYELEEGLPVGLLFVPIQLKSAG
jgi:hypothetical protein